MSSILSSWLLATDKRRVSGGHGPNNHRSAGIACCLGQRLRDVTAQLLQGAHCLTAPSHRRSVSRVAANSATGRRNPQDLRRTRRRTQQALFCCLRRAFYGGRAGQPQGWPVPRVPVFYPCTPATLGQVEMALGGSFTELEEHRHDPERRASRRTFLHRAQARV